MPDESPRPIAEKKHHEGIDALRGLAAFGVTVFHMNLFGFGVTSLAATHFGSLGVNLFFVLSGFLIARTILTPKTFSRRAYLESRTRRIVPNYLAALLIACCISNARPLTERPLEVVAGDLAAHFTFTHAWFPQFAQSLLGVLWTLSHEWWFYMLMLAAAGALRGRVTAWIFVGAMAAIALVARLGDVNEWWTLPMGVHHPLAQWDGFAWGIAGAILTCKATSTHWTQSAAARWGMGVAGLGIMTFYVHRQFQAVSGIDEARFMSDAYPVEFHRLFWERRSNMLWFVPGFAAGCAMLILSIWESPRLAAMLRRTPLPWMGKVSYSTYLYHLPVIAAFAFAVRKAPEDSLWRAPWFACSAVLAAVHLVSAFAYHHIEKPWQRRAVKAP